MTSHLVITNCKPLGGGVDAPTQVGVRDGAISGLGAAAERVPGAPVLDAGGRTLIPGLIDVHIHGVGGADLMDGTAEALETMSAALARLGTTSFLPTGFALPDRPNPQLPAAAEVVDRALPGAHLLGLHLEGPFVNLVRRGGIPEYAIAPPSRDLLERTLDDCRGALGIMTIAPELDGALQLIERLREAGVVASFGHSAASYQQTLEGIAAGLNHVTHLYNAMPGMHHREPGPVLAIHEAELPYELVCDDVHVSRHVARWTARVFGLERCMIITDAMRTTGLPDGEHAFPDRTLISRGGAVHNVEGTLVGTALPLLEIVRRLDEYTGCGFERALDCATRVPADLLALRKGRIEVGFDADLVVLDEDGSVWATIVGGEVVYRKDSMAR